MRLFPKEQNAGLNPAVPSIMWTTIQDGVVITAKMTEDEVWSRCQLFGAERLADAIENFLGRIGLPQETEEVPVIIDGAL